MKLPLELEFVCAADDLPELSLEDEFLWKRLLDELALSVDDVPEFTAEEFDPADDNSSACSEEFPLDELGDFVFEGTPAPDDSR